MVPIRFIRQQSCHMDLIWEWPQLPSNYGTSISKKQLLARLDVCMGERVAEELIFCRGHITTGASSDLQSATELAQYMVSSYGMSDAIWPVHIKERPGSEMQSRIDVEVVKLVKDAYEHVRSLQKKIPPPGKGSMYIRPLLMGSGSVLGLAPALEYTILIYVSPVGNYFKEGLSPINLLVETEMHRATPGNTGGVKTIGNYVAVLNAQGTAKAKGYYDVLYLYNIFIVKVYLKFHLICF